MAADSGPKTILDLSLELGLRSQRIMEALEALGLNAESVDSPVEADIEPVLVEHLVDVSPVRHAGEAVAPAQLFDFGEGALELELAHRDFGDVLDDDAHVRHVATVVSQGQERRVLPHVLNARSECQAAQTLEEVGALLPAAERVLSEQEHELPLASQPRLRQL